MKKYVSKSATLLASISTNTVNPFSLGAPIINYKYIYITVSADNCVDHLFLIASLISDSNKYYYNCWATNSYYVAGHIIFNSSTTVRVSQDEIKGWSGTPGSVLIYGIN